MRIVSLLPSTTEILFVIGAGDHVVGVTVECDTPVEARERAIVSTTTIPGGLTSREIDAFVSAAMAAGEDLYHLDQGALSRLDADLVVTQDLCAVCAVDVSVVDEALDYLGCRADVLTIDPHTLADVLDSVVQLGQASGTERAATALVKSLTARLYAVEQVVRDLPRPRALVLEWTDPPFAPGHWVPEMVEAAGGASALGRKGEKSVRIRWDDVRGCGADVVVCAPCGYDLEGAAALGEALLASGELPPGIPVWAVDANASFARPGPRLVDGVEALAGILHPDAAQPPNPMMARRLR
ncbi:MAG TPA: ABC transporter substrate-binding protein [Pedococcus sp.]|nr:ABC transporter substrate-binding protein [Pedococcus sp.]